VDLVEPLGAETFLHLTAGGESFVARWETRDRVVAGQRFPVTFDLAKAHMFDAASETALF
jgi:multiple sugar transport system ATP-binding protein